MRIDALRGPPISAPPTAAAPSTGGAAEIGKAPAAGAADFSSLLGEAIAGLSQQLKAAETVATGGIRGTESTQAVVEQVMAAEHTLQASIAVRDKIVAAYLEISRMAI
jgi:flagellar hook-basal body complex protein FliE